MTIRQLTLLATATLLAPAHASSLSRITAGLPEVTAPPQGEVLWVARSMRLNGLPMTLQTFQSRLKPDQLLRHYESWAHGHDSNETHRSTQGSWNFLVVRSSRYHITIQVEATIGGSEGTIIVSPRLERATLTLETQFPRPASASIVNLQQYDDFGVESEHISLTSPRSVTMELLAFSELLARDGWQVMREQRSEELQHSYVMEVQKGAQHALLTLQPDHARPSTTAIVIVWRKS